VVEQTARRERLTLDECRLELSKAYNTWYAAQRRLELLMASRTGLVNPTRQRVRLTRSNVITLEIELAQLLKTTEGPA
jgi:hypothetical protein